MVVVFLYLLILLSTVPSSFIHVVSIYIYHIFFIELSTGKYLGYLHVLALVNNAFLKLELKRVGRRK